MPRKFPRRRYEVADTRRRADFILRHLLSQRIAAIARRNDC